MFFGKVLSVGIQFREGFLMFTLQTSDLAPITVIFGHQLHMGHFDLIERLL